jgi:hypothetical protein
MLREIPAKSNSPNLKNILFLNFCFFGNFGGTFAGTVVKLFLKCKS